MIELKRILLVEDNQNDVELTIEALREYNLANEVQVVRDGQEALDFLHRHGAYEQYAPGNPAVILLDLKLPKISGHEVLEQIKSDDKLKCIPVVVLTSSREEYDRAKCYENYANAYVVKPIDFHEFINAVKELGVFWLLVNEPPPGSIRKEI